MCFPNLLVQVERFKNIEIHWMDIEGNLKFWKKDQIDESLSELL